MFKAQLPSLSWEDDEVETSIWDQKPSDIVAVQNVQGTPAAHRDPPAFGASAPASAPPGGQRTPLPSDARPALADTELLLPAQGTIPVRRGGNCRRAALLVIAFLALLAAVVVVGNQRLGGVLNIHGVVDVIEQEAEEDLLRLGGVGDEELSDTVLATSRSRIPWLMVNLVTAFLAASVIGLFDTTIEKIVALAILMPIVAGMGGNAASQTMTVTVRALATKDLDIYNSGRIIRREMAVGVLHGVIFAVLIGIVAALWFQDVHLGGIVAAAIVVNLFVAALAGILIPLLLDRFGADPAVASAVFVTAVTDVVGFSAFLGLAAWWFGVF